MKYFIFNINIHKVMQLETLLSGDFAFFVACSVPCSLDVLSSVSSNWPGGLEIVLMNLTSVKLFELYQEKGSIVQYHNC